MESIEKVVIIQNKIIGLFCIERVKEIFLPPPFDREDIMVVRRNI